VEENELVEWRGELFCAEAGSARAQPSALQDSCGR